MAPIVPVGSDELHWLYQRSSIGHNLKTQVSAEVVMPALATLSVLLRFTARIKYHYGIKWDDIIIAISLLFAWGLWGVWYHEAVYIIKTSVSEVAAEKQSAILKSSFAQEFLYVNGCNVVKIAIIMFYFRAIATTRKVRIYLWILSAFIASYAIARFLAEMFQCRPVSYMWNRTQAGYCTNFHYLLLSTQIVNVVADVAVLAFPIPIVWSLTIPTQQKVALGAVFCLGGVACAASATRIWLVDSIFKTTSTSLLSDDAIPKLLAAAQVELNVSIMCASLPAVRTPARTFTRKWMNRLFGHKTPNASSAGASADSTRIGKGAVVNEIELPKSLMSDTLASSCGDEESPIEKKDGVLVVERSKTSLDD